jgi:hypothetical protein
MNDFVTRYIPYRIWLDLYEKEDSKDVYEEWISYLINETTDNDNVLYFSHYCPNCS